ncbi:MAG TPA: hypothetical protein PKC28_11020 [Bdellovibrionales bacterium]|nr:hypothetical protein [Bdellovibrionales bacterium]
MKARVLLALGFCLTLVSCLQTENSSVTDDSTFSGEGTAEYRAAKAVMTENCAGCHAYHTLSEAALIDQGLMIAGDPENSPLYFRLIGSAGPQGPKDMPQSGGMSEDRVATIRAWIETAP